jgi:DNA polymerase III epsilon subunit-like protein
MPGGVRYAMIFDVETTGLLPKADPVTKSLPTLESFPHIIQFSWIIYDLATNMIDMVENHYIQLPSNVVVTNEITNITGITQPMCDGGKPIADILALFYKMFMSSDYVIAHNIQFDATLVYTELTRNREAVEMILQRKIDLDIFNDKYKQHMYCTMVASKEVCNIIMEWKPRPTIASINANTQSILSPLPSVMANLSIEQDVSISSATVELIVIPDSSSGVNANKSRPLTPTRSEYEPVITANNSPKNTLSKSTSKSAYKSNTYSSTPKTYKKFPKLSELHQHLFGYVPENLHNALIDVLVCLRCFLKLRCSYSMSNRKFDILLKKHQKR